jgi:hypothetical protein
MNTTRTCFRWLLMLLVVAGVSRAADVSVKARFSHRVAEVGSKVQLQIEIVGVKRSVSEPEVAVEGLKIGEGRYQDGSVTQWGPGGIQTTTTVTWLYDITPEREGEFTIPELPVNVDGNVYRTKPVTLKVQKSTTPAGGAKIGEAKAFAEITLKKKTAYVGEVVPVEVRLFVDERVRIEQVTNMPDLTGEGFTMRKFPRAEQERERRDGQTYNTIVFRTVMTPGKAGKLTIGPCEIPFIAGVQRQRAKGRNGAFDLLLNDDFFDPFGALMERKRFDAKGNAVEIEVKPLPVEGRPKDFSGAVGQFKMSAEGTPIRIKFGDPVTMRMTVSGEGDFDRVKAPVIADPEGWQVFDASEKFEASNESNTSGTKRFEMPVVPEKAHKRMPKIVFSYFDPAAEKYKTDSIEGEPLTIDGAPADVPKSEPSPTEDTAAAPASAAKKMEDIAGLRYEPGIVRTFAPLYERGWFRWINAGLVAGAMVLVLARMLHREPEQLRLAALRRERDATLGRLGDGEAFAENAAHAVQVEAALAAGMEAASVDASMARRALRLSDEDAAVVERIFDERAALLYAGGSAESRLDENERGRIEKVLRRICRR